MFQGPEDISDQRTEDKGIIHLCWEREEPYAPVWRVGDKYNRLGHRGRKMAHRGWLLEIPHLLARKYKPSGSRWEWRKHMGRGSIWSPQGCLWWEK